MSGLVGHVMYGVLGAKAARQRKLPVAGIIERHWASYLCGSYLGCDIQTMPEAICVETGKEVGYGTAKLEKSPLTGGPVKPWHLEFGGRKYTPREIHTLFYGRSHLVFGWKGADTQHTVPWDHLDDYVAAAVGDAIELFGPGERKLAYLFGWACHIVGDSLIKSVRPGVDLELLGAKYTPRNRPIQDLVTFHDIGRKELGLNWVDLFADLAATPVEPAQVHYMRAGRPRGRLGETFANAWEPALEPLLLTVLAENRRYQQIRNGRLLKQLALKKTRVGWQCDEELSGIAGGLSYAEMLEAADKADFRHALWQMGEAVADLFERVVERQPLLQDFPVGDGPGWEELTGRWKG
ncbi:MAG: hypothetical protein CMJ48_11480 [Planctomycetaceae bacterium]|nr:hypothetical protein [Planctomycetaceae bacterium]